MLELGEVSIQVTEEDGLGIGESLEGASQVWEVFSAARGDVVTNEWAALAAGNQHAAKYIWPVSLW